jgi:hypothetical protein
MGIGDRRFLLFKFSKEISDNFLIYIIFLLI